MWLRIVAITVEAGQKLDEKFLFQCGDVVSSFRQRGASASSLAQVSGFKQCFGNDVGVQVVLEYVVHCAVFNAPRTYSKSS